MPATTKIQLLCDDNVTSQGAADSNEATVAPSPNNTSSDGSAQQSRVPADVNSDTYCSQNERRTGAAVWFIALPAPRRSAECPLSGPCSPPGSLLLPPHACLLCQGPLSSPLSRAPAAAGRCSRIRGPLARSCRSRSFRPQPLSCL